MIRPVHALIEFLKESKLTIAFAESITCGLLSHQLNTVKGTSEVLMGSIICYDESVKINLMKVSRNLIKKNTAESQAVTDDMVKKLRRLIDADIHAAVTGLAAPGASESNSKPVGTVFYSFMYRNKLYRLKKRFIGTPLLIKKKSCDEFYKFLLSVLIKAH